MDYTWSFDSAKREACLERFTPRSKAEKKDAETHFSLISNPRRIHRPEGASGWPLSPATGLLSSLRWEIVIGCLHASQSFGSVV